MSNKSVQHEGTVRAVLVPLAFLAVAAGLLSAPRRFDSPVAAASVVPEWVVDPATVRQPGLVPEITLGSFTYPCSDCHRLFSSRPESTASLIRHTDIVLKHGINTRCFNCHNIFNRDTFADDIGGELPYDQPQLLCAKCHGPVYRDWQHGAHGRSNGYWDTRRGPMTRKKCVECHDPHQPPFPPMAPAPPPNTLRMGPQAQAEHVPGGNPLRVYDQPDVHGHAAAPLPAVGDSGEGR